MSNYRHKNGAYNKPGRDLVLRVAQGVADEMRIPVSGPLGPSARRADVAARREAWRRILRQTGCSINGLAEVWGCDRQAIWRPLFKQQPSTARQNSTPELWITPFEQLADGVD